MIGDNCKHWFKNCKLCLQKLQCSYYELDSMANGSVQLRVLFLWLLQVSESVCFV